MQAASKGAVVKYCDLQNDEAANQGGLSSLPKLYAYSISQDATGRTRPAGFRQNLDRDDLAVAS